MPYDTENIATKSCTCKTQVAADAAVVIDEGDLAEYFIAYLQEHHPERQQWLDAGFPWLGGAR